VDVYFGEAGEARLAAWRRRAESVEHSFLEVWARPAEVAAAIFALAVVSVVLSREMVGTAQVAAAVDGAATAGVLVIALITRLTTRGPEVQVLATEIAALNTRAAGRLSAALDALPDSFRREIRADAAGLFRGADGPAVVVVTVLVIVVTAIATSPAVGLVGELGLRGNLYSAIGALIASAAVLPALVRLIVATTAEATRQRAGLIEELAVIVEESRGRRGPSAG
jgi:hypothetical protein